MHGTIDHGDASGDTQSRARDASSRELHERLNAAGPEREAAVVELHALLLKAARFSSR
jgi:hypothetical protein